MIELTESQLSKLQLQKLEDLSLFWLLKFQPSVMHSDLKAI